MGSTQVGNGLHPALLDQILPFHILIGEDLTVRQFGSSMPSVAPEMQVGDRLDWHLDADRPAIDLRSVDLDQIAGKEIALVSRTTQTRIEGRLVHSASDALAVFTGPIAPVASGPAPIESDPPMVQQQRDESGDRRTLLETVFATVVDGIVVIDSSGLIEQVNQAALHMLGWTEDELLGRNVGVLMPPEIAREHDGYIGRFLETGEKRVIGIGRRVEAQHHSGRRISVDLTVSDMRIDGEVKFTGVLRDVTEREETQAALRAEKERAEHLARSRADFLASMSHEIRTPLNAVLGMASLMADAELPEKQRQQVDLINAASRNLLRVLDDVLDVASVDSGRMTLERRPFGLAAAIEQTVGLFAPLAAEHGIDLSHAIAPDVPTTLIGDEGRLRQILSNLIGNAVKFTHKGGVEVACTAAPVQEDAAGREITINVRDTGIGIPQERIAQLFQEFSQVHAERAERYGGTGLGLAISQRLTQLMGGSITVMSIEGEGTTFELRIPLATADSAQREAPRADRRPSANLSARPVDAIRSAPASGLPGAPRILVVEDNSANRAVMEAFLERLGCSHITVGSGREAITAAGEHPFDVVLLDVQLPDMSGLDVSRALIEQDPSPRRPWLVAVTAMAMSADRDRALSAGMDEFVSKPIQRQSLEEALQHSLRRRQLRAAHIPEESEDQATEHDAEPAESPLAGLPDEVRREITQVFLAEFPTRIVNIRAAASDKDPEALRAAAHELKGAALIFGEGEVPSLCQQLEHAGREGNLATVPALLDKFEPACDRLVERLSAS